MCARRFSLAVIDLFDDQQIWSNVSKGKDRTTSDDTAFIIQPIHERLHDRRPFILVLIQLV